MKTLAYLRVSKDSQDVTQQQPGSQGSAWAVLETLGTSKLDGKEAEIQRLWTLNVSKASIAKITGVDRSTLYLFIRSRRL